jgi:proteasome accessory factor C
MLHVHAEARHDQRGPDPVSHDADKLIRQLSLVAYIMAEKRPITARDAKNAVEGYYDMSDEAFARRFYADRAELLALGVPIKSNRDEFTGEELYTLTRENYFLPPLHLDDRELAALQTSLFLLDGQFAYAAPLRLALQNLALGRPGVLDRSPSEGVTLDLRGGGHSPEIAARLAKLEGAISKQKTIVFPYYAISTGKEATRTVDPYGLYYADSNWYLVGHDHGRDAIRNFRVSRIRGEMRFHTRKERDFRRPAEFDPAEYRDRAPWLLDAPVGEAELYVAPSAAWLVDRLFNRHGEVVTHDDRSATFETQYSDLDRLVEWILGLSGQVLPLGPSEVVEAVVEALERVGEAHAGDTPAIKPPKRIVPEAEAAQPRVANPVAPERFAVLQALLADLLETCGTDQSGSIAASVLQERYGIDDEEMVEQINLLNLVNFGGGCYAVYAELDEDGMINVQKELYGEDFRRPARLSPLEAKAILMALDLVGPQIAAGTNSTLSAVREKIEIACGGGVPGGQPSTTAGVGAPEDVISTISRAIERRRLVRIVYLTRRTNELEERLIEPYLLRGVNSDWYIEAYDRTQDGERTFRIDRIESAELQKEQFEPREGLSNRSEDRSPGGSKGTVSVWFSPAIARLESERRTDASHLTDGAILATITYDSERWLEDEVIKYRGEAVLIEPAALRARVARRAAQLVKQVRGAKRLAAKSRG